MSACQGEEEATIPPTPDPWFEEARLEPAFAHAGAVWAGAALLDYDADGWLDLFLTNGKSHLDALYRNNGDGSFTDQAAAAGFTSLGESGAVVAGDIDNDGDEDLIVSDECSTGSWGDEGQSEWDGDKRLYRNNGDGTFTEESLPIDPDYEQTLHFCTISMTLLDVDQDGWLDLVLSNGSDPDIAPPWIFDKHSTEAVNYIYKGDGAGSFEEVIQLQGTVVTFTAVGEDLNGDGRMDLILGQGGLKLEVQLQAEDGSFQPSDASAQVARGLWMGIAVADFDHDGDMDLYGTNMGLSPLMAGYDSIEGFYPGKVTQVVDPFDPEGEVTEVRDWVDPSHAMLLDEGGRLVQTDWPLVADQLLAGDLFTDPSGQYPELLQPAGLSRYAWSWGAAPADIDADGWTDVLFTSNNCSAPMNIIWDEEHGAGPGGYLHNDAGVGFTDQTWLLGIENTDAMGRYQDGRGLAVGDLNNDGYPDLVFANRTYNPTESSAGAEVVGTPHIWLSRAQTRTNHWLQVDLEGTESNRDGIGAILTLRDGETSWVHPFGPGGATNSSHERMLTVGLGEATQVELSVRFPSGITVEVGTVEADQRITVREEP